MAKSGSYVVRKKRIVFGIWWRPRLGYLEHKRAEKMPAPASLGKLLYDVLPYHAWPVLVLAPKSHALAEIYKDN